MDPIETYIRNAAAQRGIDPDQAMRVARSEGFNSYTGDNGSSFGPFQLHYGGVAPGGNRVSGLGDVFTAKTGLDARDPRTIPQQIDFALDHAAQNGWGPWHGWKGDQWAGINGSPAAPSLVAGNAPVSAAPAPQPAAPGSDFSEAGTLGGGGGNGVSQLAGSLINEQAPTPAPMQQQPLPSTAQRLAKVMASLGGLQQTLPSDVSRRLIDVIGKSSGFSA